MLSGEFEGDVDGSQTWHIVDPNPDPDQRDEEEDEYGGELPQPAAQIHELTEKEEKKGPSLGRVLGW